VDILLLKFKVTWSVSLIHWSVVLWRARKPNWLALRRHFSSMYIWTIFRLTHLFNHCLRLSYFPKPWKEAKVITLPKPGKDPKLPQNLRPISLLSTTGKLFEKSTTKPQISSLITTLHVSNRKHRFQQYLYCCLSIRCSGNVFTEPLPSSERLLWLHCSDFQATCHNTNPRNFGYGSHQLWTFFRVLVSSPKWATPFLNSENAFCTTV
jgi:hypothetical protein